MCAFETGDRVTASREFEEALYLQSDLTLETVLFSTAVTRAMGDGTTLFVELSPHPILVPALQEGLSGAGPSGVALGTLRREQPERRCLLESVGELYVRGQEVAWDRLHPGGKYVSLPTYPFERERYWITDDPAPAAAASEPHLPAPPAQRFGETDRLAPGEGPNQDRYQQGPEGHHGR